MHLGISKTPLVVVVKMVQQANFPSGSPYIIREHKLSFKIFADIGFDDSTIHFDNPLKLMPYFCFLSIICN